MQLKYMKAITRRGTQGGNIHHNKTQRRTDPSKKKQNTGNGK